MEIQASPEEDTKSMSEHERRFSVDRPIASRGDDKLSRAGFAQALADAICGWHGEDSLVVGLCGPWGAGKSSVKNLMVEAIAGRPETDRPHVIDFNAWAVSGEGALGSSLLERIADQLGSGKNEGDKNAASLLRKLAKKAAIAGGLGAVARWVALGAGAAMEAHGVPGAGAVATGVAAIGANAAAGMKEIRDGALAVATDLSGTDSADDVKRKAAELLRRGARNVVVFVDDVDRLTTDEIRLLFRMIKVNVDLPRLVFVVLYQRDVVERALEDNVVVSGRDFLAKIVQASFDLPAVSREQLRRVLFSGLNELIERREVARAFNQDQWQWLFWKIDPFFQTLRDVHRVVSTLSLHFGLFTRTGAMEVNPVDLIGLEVLRTFEPEVYRALPEFKSELTDEREPFRYHQGDQWKQRIATAFQELQKRISPGRQEITAELLKELFPILGTSHQDPEQAERDLRLCAGRIFERYFFFDVPPGGLSQAQMDRILGCLADREALTREMLALAEQKLLDELLERLEAYKQKLPLSAALPFLTALFDVGEVLADERPSMVGMSATDRAFRILYWYLIREANGDVREQILRQAIMECGGLFLPASVVSLTTPKPDSRLGDLISAESHPSFQAICAQKISAAAKDGRLLRSRHLGWLIRWWHSWGDAVEAKAWVSDLLAKSDGPLIVLRAFRTNMRSEQGRKVRVTARIQLSDLERYVDPEKIEALLGPPGSEKEDEAVRAFRRAMADRRAGRAENSIASLMEDEEEQA